MNLYPEPILTLEPFLDAVRAGVERRGWVLSGLQKTTSHQFEGRWAGDSTRSAYLFFHRPEGEEWASLEAYLDETSRGLTGNLALVVDAVPLAAFGDVPATLAVLADLNASAMPPDGRTPLTVRFHLPSPETPVHEAETEIRFKLRIPREALAEGSGVVADLAADTAERFNALMASAGLGVYVDR